MDIGRDKSSRTMVIFNLKIKARKTIYYLESRFYQVYDNLHDIGTSTENPRDGRFRNLDSILSWLHVLESIAQCFWYTLENKNQFLPWRKIAWKTYFPIIIIKSPVSFTKVCTRIDIQPIKFKILAQVPESIFYPDLTTEKMSEIVPEESLKIISKLPGRMIFRGWWRRIYHEDRWGCPLQAHRSHSSHDLSTANIWRIPPPSLPFVVDSRGAPTHDSILEVRGRACQNPQQRNLCISFLGEVSCSEGRLCLWECRPRI